MTASMPLASIHWRHYRLATDGLARLWAASATDANPDGSPGGLHQLQLQAIGVVATLAYSGIGSWVLS